MSEPRDTWQPIGTAALAVLSRLDDEHRRVFAKECERDGIRPSSNRECEATEGVSNA